MPGAALLICCLVAGLLGVAATPVAAQDGAFFSPNGVLYGGCRDHTFSYSVSPGSSEWSVDVDLIDPSGDKADDVEISSEDEVPTSGTATFFLCSGDPAGVYKIRGVLTWNDGDVHTESLPAATFRMRKAYTRTSLTVSDATPHFNEIVTIRSQTREERPTGYVPMDYPTVRLQVRRRSGWENVDRLRTGGKRGFVEWKYRWNIPRTVKLRAVTISYRNYRGSNSRTVTIDQRRGGRVAVPSSGSRRRTVHVVPALRSVKAQ